MSKKPQAISVFNIYFWLGLSLALCVAKLFGALAWAWWVCLLPLIFCCSVGLACIGFAWLCLGIASWLQHRK